MKKKYLRLKSCLFLALSGMLGLQSCRTMRQHYTFPESNHQQPEEQTEKEVPEVEPAEPDTLGPRPEIREEIRLLYGVPTTNFRER